VIEVSLEARTHVLRVLESGPKTPNELRDFILGETPKDAGKRVEYKTRYQALRRALLDLVKEGIIEEPKYRLLGEQADQKFIRASMGRFDKTNDSARQRLLMEDIEAESEKRDAILTPRLLIFFGTRLTDRSEYVRKLAIKCLRDISRRITESRRDADWLLAMRKQCGRKLVDAVVQDPSIEVRKEALKLLVDLGERETIPIVEKIMKDSTTEKFREFRPILKQYLVQPYPTNRLLKTRKGALRDMLEDLVLSDDQRLVKRATVVLWSLRHGQADMPEGEADIQ
jgi:uncharacterized membrane-anchored protein YjiN (DUF445 family)